MKEIRKILEEYDVVDHAKERVALASVVNVEESSYRRIGARMLVRSSGLWVGGISGGCLEGDALKRAQHAIYKGEPSLVIYDTREEDENQIGVGLGCNGKIEVLFTPIDPDDAENPVEQLREIIALNRPVVQLHVIDTEGNGELLGKSRLVYPISTRVAFCEVKADDLEEAVLVAAQDKCSKIISVTSDLEEKLSILVEYHHPELKLVIFGDNYDVLALAAIAKVLGWEIHLVGQRKKLTKEVYRMAKRVYEFSELDAVPIDEFTAVVLMSHDFKRDKTALPGLLGRRPRYLGMLGPKKRMLKMKKELGIADLGATRFFYSPIGLDIGAESPEEIALAITGEIVAVFRGEMGGSLKFKNGPIHGRR